MLKFIYLLSEKNKFNFNKNFGFPLNFNLMSLSGRTFKVLFGFQFPKGLVFEVKYLDVSESAPKSDQYQWFFFHENSLESLQFKSMEENKRTFQNQSELYLDKLIFKTTKDEFSLEKADEEIVRKVLNL